MEQSVKLTIAVSVNGQQHYLLANGEVVGQYDSLQKAIRAREKLTRKLAESP